MNLQNVQLIKISDKWKIVHPTVQPIVQATKKYQQNEAVTMANEHAPPGEDYKAKYFALLEKVASENKYITDDVFERTLAALNARHSAFQEYVLSALSRLENEGSYEERAAEVHKMMIQKMHKEGTSSGESIQHS